MAHGFQRLQCAAHTRDAADGCAHRQYRVYGSICADRLRNAGDGDHPHQHQRPTAPFVDVSATGVGGTGAVATAIANSGSFGNVCLGSYVDEILTINNSGTCQLLIYDIAGSADFLAPSVVSYPLAISAGASIDVVIRFQPSSFGPKAGTITIYSNDPASPSTVFVSGVAQAPKANLIIANSGNFGHVCVGSFVDEPLIVTNSGKCTLSVTGIASNSGDFLVPEVLSYPITIGPGDALPVPIRFQPGSFGAKFATITVSSDDPASPISIKVFGDAPAGKLAVSGSTTFGGVSAGCCADRTLSICNVGDCALHVTNVHIRTKGRHWRLLHNPFPAKLRPGSCLPLVIQYRANEKCPRCSELVIECDDPVTPVKVMELLAYTIWDLAARKIARIAAKAIATSDTISLTVSRATHAAVRTMTATMIEKRSDHGLYRTNIWRRPRRWVRSVGGAVVFGADRCRDGRDSMAETPSAALKVAAGTSAHTSAHQRSLSAFVINGQTLL